MIRMASGPDNRVASLFLAGMIAFFVPVLSPAAEPEAGAQEKPAAVQEKKAQSGSMTRLSIEGISASAGEDEPRVLTILPWQAPTLPRRPRAELESKAPELVQPLDPRVIEAHRAFRQRLDHTPADAGPGGRR